MDRSLNDIIPSFPSGITRRHGRFVYRNNLCFIAYVFGRQSSSDGTIFHSVKTRLFFTSIIISHTYLHSRSTYIIIATRAEYELKLRFQIRNQFFVTPAPKVWFSIAVEALESVLFPSSGNCKV